MAAPAAPKVKAQSRPPTNLRLVATEVEDRPAAPAPPFVVMVTMPGPAPRAALTPEPIQTT